MENIYNATPDVDLQSFLDSLPENAVVHLAPGIYRQKIEIRTPGLTLIGADEQKTILVYDDYAQKLDEQGREYVTFRTYTVAVLADRVHFEHLAIVNDALYPEIKGQEVALTVCGDDFTMDHCRLTSTQDTLFVGPLPPDLIVRYDGFLKDELRQGRQLKQTFTSCLIEGTVDFIFGCGNALFEACEIRSLVDARGHGFVAAPAHSLTQTEGLTFRSCRLTCQAGVEPGSVWLARPWRDYGIALFENCTYDVHINPLGFDKWNDTDRNKTARFTEIPAVKGRVAWCNRTN